MIFLVLPVLFLAFPFSLFSGEVKLLILEKEKALEKAKTSKEKAPLYYEIALNYLKDQDQEKAFKNFLLALKNTEKEESCELLPEEKAIYDEALKLYLDEGAVDPLKTASTILSCYGKKGEENRHFYHLNMLLASSYANGGDFEKFFIFFYENYPRLKQSFLADKARAMLNLRLYATAITQDEKKYFENESKQYLNLALEKNGSDSSLYKFLMIFSKDEQKIFYLKKLCENKVKLPRSEILFYINEAKQLCQKELGQKIIEIQSGFYEYSRSLEAAKQFLY